MTSPKFIFLDIDGVLNSSRSFTALGGCPFMDEPQNWKKYFDPVAIALMKRLVVDTQATVILTSSWRLKATPQQIDNLAIFLDLPIIGTTGFSYQEDFRRAGEIEEWLDENGHCQYNCIYVIIDDMAEWKDYQKNTKVVQVCGYDGFSMKNWYDACRILGHSPSIIPKV